MNKRINATSVRISPYYSRRKANLTIGKCNVETIRSIDSCPIKLKVQYNAKVLGNLYPPLWVTYFKYFKNFVLSHHKSYL